MHVRKWARRAGGRCLGFGLVPGVWAACALWACCGAAGAQLLLSNSRLVYPAGARQVEMTMTNDGKRLITAQAWVDAGDVDARPEDTQAPFLVSPPVSKIQPGQTQTLRISYTGSPPSGDRETLYYLNILDIAPKPENTANVNSVRMNVRTRFKIFVRPAGLGGDPASAAAALHWAIGPNGTTDVANTSDSSKTPTISPPSDKAAQLIADNPSPYFLSLINVRLLRGKEVLQELPPAMAAPFGCARFTFNNVVPAWEQSTTVQYDFIDDHGVEHTHVHELKARG